MNLEVDSKGEVMHIKKFNEWSVIFSEETVGRRERVTTDEERILQGRLKRDKVVEIGRLTGCKNFVGKREKFVSYGGRSVARCKQRQEAPCYYAVLLIAGRIVAAVCPSVSHLPITQLAYKKL